LVGFKPTQQRVPRDGAFALSESLDSVGSVARTVECCALLDAVMAGARHEASELPIAGLRLAIPKGIWMEGLDRTVARAFERTLERLAASGVQLIPHDFTLGAVVDIERSGVLIGAEAYTTHRALLGRQGASYDPRVRARLAQFETVSAADYIDAARCRREAVERFAQQSRQFDAVLAPTVAIVPPRFDELEHLDDFRRINPLVRRNAALVNLLDGCALSVPCQEPGELPVGLMIVGGRNTDAHVLAVGTAIERMLAATQ
jgi:aspartyl-tRNA(Asn)/glutamyl-tRNA(Gln) amidotransferase subunit A